MRKSLRPIVLELDNKQDHSEHSIVGCLWGIAVGDALGLPCEGLSKHRQQRIYPNIAGYHLLFGHGMVSDDTEHTWMTAQVLCLSKGNPALFGSALAHQLRVWRLAIPAGVGFATLRAILRLCLGWSWARSSVYSAGNGPAMRSALIGVCYGQDPGAHEDIDWRLDAYYAYRPKSGIWRDSDSRRRLDRSITTLECF